MYTLNQLTIIGFTGNDAEAHYTPNGTLVVTLSVATKESWKDTDSNWQSRTDWHRIVTFGKVAEYTRTLTKGSYVMVQGAVRTREYERDGIKHRVTEVRAESIGKLDIPAYASLLRESAIGVSLMISPHPSYPPLEMAHLGLLVLTNGFASKDPSTWHSNIHSVDDVSAASIATALSVLCRRFEADPDIGRSGASGRPDYTSDEQQFPFAAQLAADLRYVLGRGGEGDPRD